MLSLELEYTTRRNEMYNGRERRKEKRREDIDCTPQTCQYHVLTESVIADLKQAVEKLMEGQDQMKETVIHLTEAFKAMERIDARMEKLEDLQRVKDQIQDAKLDEVKGFMYKAMGALAAIGALGGVVLKYFGVG